MNRKGHAADFFIMLMVLMLPFIFFSVALSDTAGNAIEDGHQIGEIDKILTTGNGGSCTVFIDNKTYTVSSGLDDECLDASTGFVLYEYDGRYWLKSPEEVRRNGGVVP